MSDFQLEMVRAGVITQKEYEQQKEREKQDAPRVVHQIADPETLDFFCSAQSFMDWVKRKLEKTPTPRQVKECLDLINQVSLDQYQCAKVHTFLKRINNGLAGRPLNQRRRYLSEVWIQNW